MSNESQQVQVTQEDIRIIKSDVAKLTTTLDEVHKSLIGSEIGKDGGLVQRLTEAEAKVEIINIKVANIEIERSKERLKTDIYRKITFFLAGSIVSALIVAIIKNFYSKN